MLELHFIFDIHDLGTKICCEWASFGQVALPFLPECGCFASILSRRFGLASALRYHSVWKKSYPSFCLLFSTLKILLQSTVFKSVVNQQRTEKINCRAFIECNWKALPFRCSRILQLCRMGHRCSGGSTSTWCHVLAHALQFQLGAFAPHRPYGIRFSTCAMHIRRQMF